MTHLPFVSAFAAGHERVSRRGASAARSGGASALREAEERALREAEERARCAKQRSERKSVHERPSARSSSPTAEQGNGGSVPVHKTGQGLPLQNGMRVIHVWRTHRLGEGRRRAHHARQGHRATKRVDSIATARADGLDGGVIGDPHDLHAKAHTRHGYAQRPPCDDPERTMPSTVDEERASVPETHFARRPDRARTKQSLRSRDTFCPTTGPHKKSSVPSSQPRWRHSSSSQ